LGNASSATRHLVALPVPSFEACEKRTAWVSSLSLVRYHGNDYSVPTEYGHREVLVKGYVQEVVIAYGSEMIARHTRSYGRTELVFDPRHYLALLDQLIHFVHILEMNSESYRLKQSKNKRSPQSGR